MKLYVGNLPYTIDDATLRGLFEGFGEVHSARVVSDRDSGQSKGFGFVEMNDSDAQSAMSALNGQEHGGRTLRVNEARPQEARTGGGGTTSPAYSRSHDAAQSWPSREAGSKPAHSPPAVATAAVAAAAATNASLQTPETIGPGRAERSVVPGLCVRAASCAPMSMRGAWRL